MITQGRSILSKNSKQECILERTGDSKSLYNVLILFFSSFDSFKVCLCALIILKKIPRALVPQS